MYYLFFTVLISSTLLVNSTVMVNSEPSCYWTNWSHWNECSVSCGGGVSVRSMSVCYCPGGAKNDTCPSVPVQQQVPCNQFLCGTQAPLNKGYWAYHNSLYGGNPWPINENTQFLCSVYPDPFIESKTWIEIILDPIYQDCSAWHYLAKEFIAAECNINNNMEVPDDVLETVSEAAVLLDTCCDFTNGQLHQAAVLREELNRANNGLGGLASAITNNGTESDDDVTSAGEIDDVSASSGAGSPGPAINQTVLEIVLSVSMVLFIAVVGVVVVWVVVKRRRSEVVEGHQFLHEENKEMEGGGEGTEMGEEE